MLKIVLELVSLVQVLFRALIVYLLASLVLEIVLERVKRVKRVQVLFRALVCILTRARNST